MKVLKFQADWCVPCANLSKWMETVSLAHEVETINVDDQPELVEKYQVRGIPTAVLINDAEEKVSGASGYGPVKNFLLELVVH